jgi:hypothetical protein
MAVSVIKEKIMPSLIGTVLLNALLAAYQPFVTEWLPRHPAGWFVIGLLFLCGGALSIFVITSVLVEEDVHDVQLHKAYWKAHTHHR